MKTIILGAGFTGLAAGIKTGATIYEATNRPGGICQYYEKDGFQFSQGGPHWIFGRGQGLEFIKSLVELKEYERKAGVYYNHIFPYPLQTTAQKEYGSFNGRTLKWWLGDNFSQAECNLFFFPFNEKYTAGLYDEVIQYDEYKTPPAGGKGFVPTFYDPVDGLTDLVNKMASKCDIRYNKKAVLIQPYSKRVVFHDGEVIEYDRLISTIPLNKCLELCGTLNFDLPYTSVLVLNIGADRGWNTPDDHWIYIPFCKSGFYRIGFYSNVDPTKAPKDKVSLSVEMAFKPEDRPDIDLITEQVIDELRSWRFIGDVITVDPTWVSCAYTWLRSNEERDKHLVWLKDRDIISTGRYGKWHFQGMTQSIEDGLNVEK